MTPGVSVARRASHEAQDGHERSTVQSKLAPDVNRHVIGQLLTRVTQAKVGTALD